MKQAIILASGPSLTRGDAAVAMASGWPVIAVNSTWQMVPDCDVIYAGDPEWWAYWHARILSPAQRWTCSPDAARRFGLHLHAARGVYNSGMRAIQFAAGQGATRIILLGFDGSTALGTHWHGEHPAGLRNPSADSRWRWAKHFAQLRPLCDRVDIINCSRYTALTLFRRQSLQAALTGERP